MPGTELPETLDADRRYPLDLHMHSTASDGALPPSEVVSLCAQRGLQHMALTDHDTMAGVAEAQQAAENLAISVLPGCELSTRWSGVGIHVVALMPQGAQGALAEGLVSQRQARIERAEIIARQLEKLGLPDALAKAREQAASERPLGRPDFARALVAAGMARDWADAFKRYLGSGKKGDVKAQWPEVSHATEWIVASGGVAVIAHPLRYKLTRRKRGLLMDAFAEAGGQAVELVNGQQNPDATRDLARQLVERGLYASLGSDFHFPGGHAAPGSMSLVPRTAAPPIWQHPLLAEHFNVSTDPDIKGE
ncbi:PHP domain-containing protein [Halomonas sp. CH40]